MSNAALNLLGIALRGGNLTVGEEPVEAVARARDARLLILAADAAANFDDNVLIVVGIFRKQQDLQFFFQFSHAGLGIVDLHKGHIADVGIFVAQQLLCGLQIGLGSLITAVGFNDGCQFLLLTEQVGGTLGIAVQVALLESIFDLEQSCFNCGKFVQHIL